jgi:hypothetical protein
LRERRAQVDVGEYGMEIIDALVSATGAISRRQAVLDALSARARELTGRDPRSNFEALTHIVERMEGVVPQSRWSAAAVATDTAAAVNGEDGQSIEHEPAEDGLEPAGSATSLEAMRAWVDGLGDEPKEGISAEDWERFRQRIKDVSSQAERLLHHGWSLRGLFGWPSGLLAQAYSRRYVFTGLYPDGRVQMRTDGGERLIAEPINETTEKCPWE